MSNVITTENLLLSEAFLPSFVRRSPHLLTELEERSRSLLLLLAAVDVHHGDVDVVEKLRVELDRVARRKEHLHVRTDA